MSEAKLRPGSVAAMGAVDVSEEHGQRQGTEPTGQNGSLATAVMEETVARADTGSRGLAMAERTEARQPRHAPARPI